MVSFGRLRHYAAIFLPVIQEHVAEAETSERKAPCRYLGVKLDSGKYEPDPSRWIRALHYPDGRRSQTKVWKRLPTCGG